jgi:hypothetical protein
MNNLKNCGLNDKKELKYKKDLEKEAWQEVIFQKAIPTFSVDRQFQIVNSRLINFQFNSSNRPGIFLNIPD